MAVHPPGVSERVFEFAFNSEFCAKSGSLIVGCPYIPTQNQEKRLGYDVSMKIAAGSTFRSLYLQHKVARFVDGKSGSNKKFRDKVGSPYYAFSLDVNQYNLIHRFSQKKTREFYYCSPIFTTRNDLNDHYTHGTVVGNSAWIEVSACDEILATDTEPHCIVYDGALASAYRFSDEPDTKVIVEKASTERMATNTGTRFKTEDLAETYRSFLTTLEEWWPDRRRQRRKSQPEEDFQMKTTLPPRREDFKGPEQVVEAIREITGDYLGVTWLVKVDA